MATYLTRDGDVVDRIALGAYGYTAGATEAVLDANPQLADVGPVLPAGLSVLLPSIPPRQAAGIVKLWD